MTNLEPRFGGLDLDSPHKPLALAPAPVLTPELLAHAERMRSMLIIGLIGGIGTGGGIGLAVYVVTKLLVGIE